MCRSPSRPTDPIAWGQFTVVFDITPDASNPIAPVASLELVSPSSVATDPTLNDPNYVYSPNNPNLIAAASFQQDTDLVFCVASDPGMTGYNTQFAGGDIYDGSDPSSGASLVSGRAYILADLVVTFNGPAATNPGGDLFDISLNLAASSLLDGNGNALSLVSPAGGNPVIATVLVGSSAVPEPSGIVLSLFGCGIVMPARSVAVRRRDRVQLQQQRDRRSFRSTAR